jgi:hypothetical protein
MAKAWFDAEEAVAFAHGIAREVDRLFPREGPQQQKAISPEKRRKGLDGLALRTRAFVEGHKLNVYKKAKLLNTIKWELRDAGHGEALIDEIIAFLTPLLAQG